MREPDLKSGNVRAWRVRDTDASREAHMREWGHPATALDTWIINGPFHPFWSWWQIGVVHLRDVPGMPPAQKQYPEAEYEFLILSLDPDPSASGHPERPKVPDIDKLEAGDVHGGMPSFLGPPDANVHFHGCTDEQAREVCELAVRAIVSGHASPDSDYRSWWERAIPNTVEHVVNDGHPEVADGTRRLSG